MVQQAKIEANKSVVDSTIAHDANIDGTKDANRIPGIAENAKGNEVKGCNISHKERLL